MAEIHSTLAPAHPAGFAQTMAAVRLKIGEEGLESARLRVKGKPAGDAIADVLIAI